MSLTGWGLAVGLALGFAAAFGGLGALAVVALLGAFGRGGGRGRSRAGSIVSRARHRSAGPGAAMTGAVTLAATPAVDADLGPPACERGTTTVADRVIVAVAARAAAEVPGIGGAARRGFASPGRRCPAS